MSGIRNHPYFRGPFPLVFGHRGAAAEQPENTLPSFQAAMTAGAAILESDLHLTRDGEIVMIHDPAVDRTTDGSGLVADMTLAQIKTLDAGYRFTPDGGRTYPFRGQGIGIPTLREFFALFPGRRCNFEIKVNDPGLIARVLDEISATGREDITLLTASDDSAMQALRADARARGSGVALGSSTAEVMLFMMSLMQGTAPPDIAALQVPYIYGGGGYTMTLVTPDFVAHAHRHDIQVHVWTINDPAEMKDLHDMGVDGIFTDCPAQAVRLFSCPQPPAAAPAPPRP